MANWKVYLAMVWLVYLQSVLNESISLHGYTIWLRPDLVKLVKIIETVEKVIRQWGSNPQWRHMFTQGIGGNGVPYKNVSFQKDLKKENASSPFQTVA